MTQTLEQQHLAQEAGGDQLGLPDCFAALAHLGFHGEHLQEENDNVRK